MALIKNDIVSMDWESEQFFETKEGFFAAIQTYNTENDIVSVVFQNKIAFLLLDEEENAPASLDDTKGAVKTMYKEDMTAEELYEDVYVELGNTVVNEEGAETARHYGLSDEQIKDINARLDDLSGYYEIIEEAMGS